MRDTLSKRWEVEFVELKAKDEPAIEGFDIYIFEHKIPDSLPQDGVVILANPDKIPSSAGIQLGGIYNTYNGQQVPLSPGDEHPIMNGVTAESITVTQFTKISNADGYTPLMYIDDVPVVMAKNEPDQKILVISFSLNYSNFSMLFDFPMFMYNAFGYYMPSTLSGHIYEVNDEISLNSRSEILTVTDQNNVMTEFTEFPGSMLLKIPGRYSVSQIPISGEECLEYFFVKMPSSECNISEEVDSLANPFFVEKEVKENVDLLLYFALALIALLFAEWWLQSKEQF